MEKNILAISGKPGLFLLVSRGRTTLIVETLDSDKKRHAVGMRDQISSLNDISIYTNDGDIPLMKLFTKISEKYGGNALDLQLKKMSKDELADFLAGVLPDYDADRVYPNDIRKMITWYNLLVNNGYTEFETPGEEPSSEAVEENKE